MGDGRIMVRAAAVVNIASEYYHEKKRGEAGHQHLEQFNQKTAEEVSPAAIGLSQPYCKLVAIRSTQNLFMLEKSLHETDPDTTDVVVMTAKSMPRGSAWHDQQGFGPGVIGLRVWLETGRDASTEFLQPPAQFGITGVSSHRGHGVQRRAGKGTGNGVCREFCGLFPKWRHPATPEVFKNLGFADGRRLVGTRSGCKFFDFP
jgi:hypothetical protein